MIKRPEDRFISHLIKLDSLGGADNPISFNKTYHQCYYAGNGNSQRADEAASEGDYAAENIN